MVRLGSGTKSSGGWQNELADSDDEDDEEAEDSDLVIVGSHPSASEGSKDETTEDERGSSSSFSPIGEHQPTTPSTPSKQDPSQSSQYTSDLVDSPGADRTSFDSEHFRVPGSFYHDEPDSYGSDGDSDGTAYGGWVSVLRKFTLRS